MLKLSKILRSSKGSIMVETVMVCLVLMVVLVFCFETFSLITNSVNIQKIAREAAREAAIVGPDGGIEAGKTKAASMNRQYMPGKQLAITLYPAVDSQKSHVICNVTLEYRFLEFMRDEGIGGKSLNAKAVYPWWDEN